MGTANPEIAVQAASKIINDVSGIDINAGCPKHFSIHSGMGAALLKTPDILINILINLVEKIGKPNKKPISVKIRLLPEEKSSLELISKLLKTGISNLTVHCRTQNMRNRELPIRDYIPKIKKLCDEHDVSLIINGMITSKIDYIKSIQNIYGSDVGGMIATEAEINPTIFNENPIKWNNLLKEYTEIAEKMDNYSGNTKYMLTRMIPGRSFVYQLISRAKTYSEFYKVFEKIDKDGKEIKDVKQVNNREGVKENKDEDKPVIDEKKEINKDNIETKKHKLEVSINEIPTEKKQQLEQIV